MSDNNACWRPLTSPAGAMPSEHHLAAEVKSRAQALGHLRLAISAGPVHSPRHRTMASAVLQPQAGPEVAAGSRLRSTWRVVWAGLTACAALVIAVHPAQVGAAVQVPAASALTPPQPPYRQDRILIQPKPGTDRETLAAFHAAQGCGVVRSFESMGGIQILSLPEGDTVERCIAR